jgi:pectin methylesterase-like acyl-CoA thioesterase
MAVPVVLASIDGPYRRLLAVPLKVMVSFQIAIYPHGVIGNEFRSVDAAVESARQLERVGHTITSIHCGDEIYADGKALRDLLGEKGVGTFKNFPTTSF